MIMPVVFNYKVSDHCPHDYDGEEDNEYSN